MVCKGCGTNCKCQDTKCGDNCACNQDCKCGARMAPKISVARASSLSRSIR
uniref:IP02914p n=1 Tax=Drosophila melanogaster TaxID=7227 RepID=Q4V3Y5_DROME|nr:IP03114p [Drosophila melanogaster]AAY55637.2 IP02914p [Drosophila melanogaster]